MTPVYKLSASSIKGRTNYGSMLAGNTAFFPGAFESIATVTVGSGGAADVTFSSIPGTYAHLQVRAIARGESTGNAPFMRMQVNGATGSSYAYHYLSGSGSAASAGASSSTTFMVANTMYALADPASIYGATVIDILDYADTNKNTTIRGLGGFDSNGNGYVDLVSGLYNATTAITSIKFYFNGFDIAQYSHFALYGLRSA